MDRSGRTLRLGQALSSAVIAVLLLSLLAGSAMATRGGGGGKGGPKGGSGSSSLGLVLVTDQNANGAPNWADTVTFDVRTTATAYPYVALKCYQDGTLVYSANAGFYESYPWPGARNMPLESPSWTGGAASCTATLNDKLARLDFTVGA